MKNEITYTLTEGGFHIPVFSDLPSSAPIGRHVTLCYDYLKNHRRIFYNILLFTGKLFDYLHDIDTQAEELQNTMLPQYKTAYGITEQLKAENPLEWVRRLNTIAHQIDEVILTEVVYR